MGKRTAGDVQVTRGLPVSFSFTWSRDRLPVCRCRKTDRRTTRARTARQRCQNANVFDGGPCPCHPALGAMGKRTAGDVQVTRGLPVSSSCTCSRDRLPVCQPRKKDRSTTRARTAWRRCQNASVFDGGPCPCHPSESSRRARPQAQGDARLGRSRVVMRRIRRFASH